MSGSGISLFTYRSAFAFCALNILSRPGMLPILLNCQRNIVRRRSPVQLCYCFSGETAEPPSIVEVGQMGLSFRVLSGYLPKVLPE